MADPKSCGPDAYRLLETAKSALDHCEMALPNPFSDEDLANAREAVSAALPHVETRIGEELKRRLERLRREQF